MTKMIIDLLKVNIFFIVFLLTTGGCIYWLMQINEDGAKFKRVLSVSSSKKEDQLRKLEKVKVTLPAKGPYDPAQTKLVPMNKKGISELQAAFQEAAKEKEAVEKLILEKNKAKLVPMDLGIFPTIKNRAVLIYLKDIYRAKFKEYFNLWIREASGPRLNAGMPPSGEKIEQFLTQIEDEFLRGFNTERELSDLNDEEKKLLIEKKRTNLLEWLTEEASGIHLYAVSNPDNKAFPFQIDAWVNKGEDPTAHELWESQMKLWVIETICSVIMKTNQTDDRNLNVMHVPIKRLLKLWVQPGYIGDKKGEKLLGNTNPKLPLANFFHVSPSGRQSNTIYDVRHAQISMIVDWKQLPVFLKDMSDHNLLTVLSVNVTDVDEYAALRQGFVYGKLHDCVKVDMLIESIWLREWMKPWMPQKVKTRLGIK